MLIGDTTTFAIESQIRVAYERRSLLALGTYGFHINRRRFGFVESMLACSFDAVIERLERRGTHHAESALGADAAEVGALVNRAIYAPDDGIGREEARLRDRIKSCVYDQHLLMAPDGDEAFDDGSRVLHIDIGDKVRIIGYRSHADYSVDLSSLAECIVSSEAFYATLRAWCDAFQAEWVSFPKTAEDTSV